MLYLSFSSARTLTNEMRTPFLSAASASKMLQQGLKFKLKLIIYHSSLNLKLFCFFHFFIVYFFSVS